MANPKSRITSAAKKLFELKRTKARLEHELKVCNTAIATVATKDLVELMTEADLEKMTIKGYGTVYLRNEFFCNVLKDQRDELYAWLRKTNNADLIVPWVQPATLKAFVKEQFEKGVAIPDYIKVQFVPTANTMGAAPEDRSA